MYQTIELITTEVLSRRIVVYTFNFVVKKIAIKSSKKISTLSHFIYIDHFHFFFLSFAPSIQYTSCSCVLSRDRKTFHIHTLFKLLHLAGGQRDADLVVLGLFLDFLFLVEAHFEYKYLEVI